jgi:hypothetical protein
MSSRKCGGIGNSHGVERRSLSRRLRSLVSATAPTVVLSDPDVAFVASCVDPLAVECFGVCHDEFSSGGNFVSH